LGGWLLVFISLHYPLTLRAECQHSKGLERLKSMVEALVRSSVGQIGVSAKHLESGLGFEINGDTFFPMASVVKLPILIEVMAQIHEGKMSLSEEVELYEKDQFYEGGLLSELDAPGVTLSVSNLINLMMMYSDNTAADILLHRVGMTSINSRLRSFGIENVLVNRSIRALLIEYWGMEFEKYQTFPRDEFPGILKKWMKENPEALKKGAHEYSLATICPATPKAINHLLEMIFKKEILDAPTCERILDIMRKCQTGTKRIRGLLPADTDVAHKTGTVGGTVNDCGIIYLPEKLGHVALSVMSKNADPRDMENTISLIAKCVYDYFYFTL